ncbi:MAG: SDR family oxidoreductase [Spirochaetales bacterium]|nr:SDR family oxidoreductase [Spirochaetales bacterium]
MDNLTGRTALITGASKRLGRTTALTLADNGINTIIHYNKSEQDAVKTVNLSEEKGVVSKKIQYDFKDITGINDFLNEAKTITGKIDFLINSASIYPEDNLESLSEISLNNTINLNSLAPFILAREFKKICSNGAIINFLDARITDYEPNHISYQLSKQMLFNLTKMMSLEFAPGIRVNAVAPGIIIPDNIQDEKSLIRLKEGNPLKRIGTPAEVSSTALFLLQNEFITGQVIYVDGGRNLKGNVYGY